MPATLALLGLGGLLFGLGMVIGGYCPGTAIASLATGKLDALVFIVGFLIGSLVFGDLFPVWGDFYNSDYLGVFRLDQWLGVSLGVAILGVVVVAVLGIFALGAVQRKFWPVDPDDVTRAAIVKAGVDVMHYSAAVLPGAMFLVGRIGKAAVVGLPACGMFHKITIFDLILPRLLAGERLRREDFAEMGHGGLCRNCAICHHPVCSFGK